MANLFDYIKWRGDISVCHAPFCEVDALVLSEISYLDLSGIAPGDFSFEITLADAAESFFSDVYRASQSLGLIMPDSIYDIFREASKVRRFADMKIVHFVSETNESEGKQFSATAFDTGDRHIFVAFRGTDDTVVGWREDFNMSYCDAVPAQTASTEYIEMIYSHYFMPIRVGGHSKGGNLSIYCGLHAKKEIRENITALYSFDGPGFAEEIENSENYRAISDRIFSFVPENSFIGMLLNRDDRYKTVRSSASGMYQHDAFTWMINVDRFETLAEDSENNQRNKKALGNWLSAMDMEKRREFTEAIFELIESTGAKTLTDLTVDRLEKMKEFLGALGKFDREKRKMLSAIISLLVKETLKNKFKRDGE